MNILVIGGMGSLINQLIRKLKKEGHRVHLLTGSRYKVSTYESVFERYDFPYDSECLSDVFESVNPDVTIFMGAFDSNFRWSNEQREMVRFTSSLTNFLTSYSMTGKGRFIYLSSDVVYADNYEENISEDTTTSPSDLKGMALAQGEEICNGFRRIRESDIAILRLDHFYKIPKDPDEVDDVCSRMCLEAMKTGGISVNSKNRFSLLYESDAVEFIYKLVKCEEHQNTLYNVSSSQEISELEVAQYIQQAMGEDAGITIEEKDAEDRRCILSNRLYDGEFGVRIFADTQQTVEKLVNYMVERKELFLTGEQREKSLWQRITERAGWFAKAMFPYIENLICFLLFFLLNNLTVKSQFFSRLDFYLLYVLLFAVVHGQHQATFSAVLAVIGYFFAQTGDRSLLTVALDYNTYIWIAQLFIVGLVVGYMKDQIRKLKMETEEERLYLNRQLSDIKDINGSNVRVKDALETQIVNQSDSIGKIYTITSKLEKYTPEEVLFYAAEIVRDFLGSKDIALYTISNAAYARLFTFTSDKAKVLGKSIKYKELGEVYDELSNHKVYINRTLDERYPLMATAIFDNDDMQIMIMAWGISWERMTLGQADMLMVVSYLIQNAVLRAARYITMLENRRYQEDKLVMEQEAFTSLVRVFLEAREKQLTECVILQLIVPEDLSELKSLSETDVKPEVITTLLEEPSEETASHNEVNISGEESDSAERSRWSDRRSHPGKNRQIVKEQWAEKSSALISGLREKLPFMPVIAKTQQAESVIEAKDISKTEEEAEVLQENSSASITDYSRYEEAAKILSGKIRNTDYVGVLEDGNMYVLLCNTNNEEAIYAIKRIEDGGFRCILLEDFRI